MAKGSFTAQPDDYWQKAIELFKKSSYSDEEALRVLKGLIARAPKDSGGMADVFLLAGFNRYCRQHRSTYKLPQEVVDQRRRRRLDSASSASDKMRATNQALRTKAAEFDRIVEMLDHTRVGDKLLGDCTKGDLLREAVRLDQEASEAVAYAVFLRGLADLLPHGVTVRAANDRAGIVALLTHEFKEEAA